MLRTPRIVVIPLNNFGTLVNGQSKSDLTPVNIPFIQYPLQHDLLPSNDGSKKKELEVCYTFHFPVKEVPPDLLGERWAVDDTRTVRDTSFDVEAEHSLFVQGLWVKKREFEDGDGNWGQTVWIISRIYCVKEKELALSEEIMDTEQERDDYLRAFGVSMEELDLKFTFTVYFDVYKNKSDKSIECMIVDAVMPDGTIKSYGQLKSAKLDDIQEWKGKLSSGLGPIIEYISKERFGVDSMGEQPENSEDENKPRFFLDGAFDDGITDEECVDFWLKKRNAEVN